jgi:hypothetical protein
MTVRKRTLVGLAMAGVLVSATATLAQRLDGDRPQVEIREVGPFVRAGNVIINASRIEYVEIQKLENGGQILSVYLIGRTNAVARVRAAEAAELLQALGSPAVGPARAQP